MQCVPLFRNDAFILHEDRYNTCGVGELFCTCIYFHKNVWMKIVKTISVSQIS